MAWAGPLCALLSSVTWAFGTAGYSRLAREYSPFSVNFARSVVAFPLFLLTAVILATVSTGTLAGAESLVYQVHARHLGWFSLSMLCSYAFGDSLFLLSSRKIGVPAALTIASAYPLLTASWGTLVQGEPLSASQVAGLLITVGGVGAVILSAPDTALPLAADGDPSAGKLSRKLEGVLLASGSALCWALNSYAVREGGQDISMALGNTVRMLIALVLCATAGAVFARGSRLLLPAREFRRWLWLFVLEGFCGSCLFFYGLAHSPLAIGSTLASVAPVLVVPVSVGLGLESFSWKRTASVSVVVLGIWLLIGGLPA